MRGSIDYQLTKVLSFFSDIEFRRKRLSVAGGTKLDSGTRFGFGTQFKYFSAFNLGTEDVYFRINAAGTVSSSCAKIIGGASLQESVMGSVLHFYARGTPEIQVHVKR